jgi:serine phosphatase RsbU (regulator of sigma subunit)
VSSDSFGRTVGSFLEAAHQIAPHRLGSLIASSARQLGADDVRLWLADHQQRSLIHVASAEQREPLLIDGTVAGRAFMTSEVIERAEEADRVRLWVPLIDGVDRIGVMEVETGSLTLDGQDVFRRFASVATAELITRGQYTDLFTVARRQWPMSLAAELQWQALPPNSFSTDGVSVAGMMEPAYEVGGDTFDYAHTQDRLSFAILDAVGHDLGASVVSSLALGAYRNCRRSGKDLVDTAWVMDQTIRNQIGGGAFATGQLAELDTSSGVLCWLNAGHPTPLHVRQGRVLGSLVGRPRVPFGLGHMALDQTTKVAEEQLEPGDGIFLYSDGVVEARRSGGEDFGLDRLVDFLERAFAAQHSPAETLRRLSHAVLDFHSGVLQDDATTLLVVWQPDG